MFEIKNSFAALMWTVLTIKIGREIVTILNIIYVLFPLNLFNSITP
jgi:hypothetical protein